MATPKRKPAPVRKAAGKTSSANSNAGRLTDPHRTIDAELAAALRDAAEVWNDALRAVRKAGLFVLAELTDHQPANDEAAAFATPPAIKLVAIDRKHLG